MMENAISRLEALRSITIWAAKADFLELSKGSLEVGKDADFVVFNENLMTIPDKNLPLIKVEQTYIMGECVK